MTYIKLVQMMRPSQNSLGNSTSLFMLLSLDHLYRNSFCSSEISFRNKHNAMNQKLINYLEKIIFCLFLFFCLFVRFVCLKRDLNVRFSVGQCSAIHFSCFSVLKLASKIIVTKLCIIKSTIVKRI